MRTFRLAVLLAVGLALAAPGATAAAAQGDLLSGALSLGADAALVASGLDVVASSDDVPSLALDAFDVSVQRLGTRSVRADGPLSTEYNLNSIDDRASYDGARLWLSAGAGEQVVALRSLGPASAELGESSVLGVGGVLLASAQPGAEAGDACATGDLYCLDAFGVHEMRTASASAALSGELTLLLYGPTLHVVTAAGDEFIYESGRVATEDAGAAERSEDAWVVVRASSAGGSIAGSSLRIFSAAPTITTSHVRFDDAAGAMRVGAMEYRARGDDVEARGDLVLTPGAVEPAQDHGIAGETVYAESFRTRVSGDVASVNLAGRVAFLDTPAEQAGAAALVALLVAGAAYAWQHITFLGAALYTRLNKPDILDNDVRNRIYDIIRLNPGISAREVHRRSEQSWGTVVYHLRQLERHHLVVSRSLGRTRNYYENHGKYRGMEVQLACLQSDRARTLARAIVTQPGITQEQLAQASGFPQPTTSYYVRKLKQAGLVVEERDGRYVKYVPHGELPRFISLSESDVKAGGSSASGVQA